MHLQDVLAVGHSGGLSTMLVPGAGEPHYDSLVADPFQTRRMRREQEVHQLLDKLQPDMIVLDPSSIGQVPPLQPLLQAHRAQRVSGTLLSGGQRLVTAVQLACWIVCKRNTPSIGPGWVSARFALQHCSCMSSERTDAMTHVAAGAQGAKGGGC